MIVLRFERHKFIFLEFEWVFSICRRKDKELEVLQSCSFKSLYEIKAIENALIKGLPITIDGYFTITPDGNLIGIYIRDRAVKITAGQSQSIGFSMRGEIAMPPKDIIEIQDNFQGEIET